MIGGCEACSETAEMPFDYILDGHLFRSERDGSRFEGSDEVFAGAEVSEKTLVEWR